VQEEDKERRVSHPGSDHIISYHILYHPKLDSEVAMYVYILGEPSYVSPLTSPFSIIIFINAETTPQRKELHSLGL
jgi:hypothetical protein